MSSRESAADELRDVLAGMGVKDVVSAARYGSGHINDTFKVDCASGTSYILQRINTDIFDPDAVMSNIRRVTEHIRAKGGGRPGARRCCLPGPSRKRVGGPWIPVVVR